MTETELLRAKVVEEAKSWLGTPFHHEARVKGAGVDCGQFLIEVYERCGLMEHFETTHYPPDFHLHRDREWYAELLLQHCNEFSDWDDIKPADIALYKQGRVFSHGAIVIEWPKIIHAFVPRGVQYANGDQGRFFGRPVRFFRPKMFK